MPGESDASSEQAEKGDNPAVSLGDRALGRDPQSPTRDYWAGPPQDSLGDGRALTSL